MVVLGANEEMDEQRANEVEELIGAAKLLMGQQEIPYEANYRAFQIARKHKGLELRAQICYNKKVS